MPSRRDRQAPSGRRYLVQGESPGGRHTLEIQALEGRQRYRAAAARPFVAWIVGGPGSGIQPERLSESSRGRRPRSRARLHAHDPERVASWRSARRPFQGRDGMWVSVRGRRPPQADLPPATSSDPFRVEQTQGRPLRAMSEAMPSRRARKGPWRRPYVTQRACRSRETSRGSCGITRDLRPQSPVGATVCSPGRLPFTRSVKGKPWGSTPFKSPSPVGAAETWAGALSPLRGLENRGGGPVPRAYARGYSLSSLRDFEAGGGTGPREQHCAGCCRVRRFGIAHGL